MCHKFNVVVNNNFGAPLDLLEELIFHLFSLIVFPKSFPKLAVPNQRSLHTLTTGPHTIEMCLVPSAKSIQITNKTRITCKSIPS